MKFKSILSLFTSTVVLALCLLVVYILLFGTGSCSEHHIQINNGVVRTRATKLLMNKVIGVDEEKRKINISKEDSNICNKEKSSSTNNFLSLIPDFKQKSRRSSLHKQANKSSTISLLHSSPCRDNICSEHLSNLDQLRYCSCLGSASKKKPIQSYSKCRFMNGVDRDPVALISLPGSGNTWVRGLLESTTGICTGALYCDVSLRTKGFTGEFVRGGSVLVVKTHGSTPIWNDDPDLRSTKGRFGSAIFIVRNPLNALVAEWNRKVANNFTIKTVNVNSHTESAGKEWFGENKAWQDFIISQTRRWKTMIKNWLVRSLEHPVLVVKYESLKRNTATQVKRMLDFLGVIYDSEVDVEKVLNDRTQTFHRKHGADFNHYTPSQKSYIKSTVKETVRLIESSELGDVIDIEDYLA